MTSFGDIQKNKNYKWEKAQTLYDKDEKPDIKNVIKQIVKTETGYNKRNKDKNEKNFAQIISFIGYYKSNDKPTVSYNNNYKYTIDIKIEDIRFKDALNITNGLINKSLERYSNFH